MSHLIHKRDRVDERDVHFTPSISSIPATASLRTYCPPVYDQLPLQSCSANAICASILLTAAMQKQSVMAPSRLFLYYNARVNDGDPGVDNGATIRDALKAAAKPGLCPEAAWPYDTAKVMDRPPQSAYDAVATRVLEYRKLDLDLDALRGSIAQSLPVILGVNIYTSTAAHAQSTGILPMPQSGDQLMGGHAILAVGYDDASQMVLALNSCGTAFGDQGYLHLPYGYFQDDKLTYDFWTIHKFG